MTARRALHWHRILARRGAPQDLVAPDDFELRFDGAGTPAGFRRHALAYCADLGRERLLYTLLPEPPPPGSPDPFDAAFLYAAQLAAATGIVSVPFERLGELPGAADLPSPVFVFSPGRTGSTLLARLLRAAGHACASEPDLPTQLCGLDATAQDMLGPDLQQALVRAGAASLAAHLGPAHFVKLRSQCNTRPELLLAALPQARAVFMLRHHLTWALSRHRAFAEPPAMVADILRQAMVAIDRLRRAGHPPVLVRFEQLLADPAGTLAAILPDPPPNAAALQAVLARDAQAGTALDRDLVQARGVEAGFINAFRAEWAERRPAGGLGARVGDVMEIVEGEEGVLC